MINTNVLFYISIVLFVIDSFFMVAIYVSDGMLNDYEITKKKRKRVRIVLLISLACFMLSIIFIVFSWTVNNSIRRGAETGKYETDYSSVQTMNYEKITLTKNRESSKAVVYLKDGTSYVIRGRELFLPLYDYCVVKTNDDNFADCFIKAGEKYTSKGNVFYAEISFDDNTLYVDEDTYDKIFGIEETEIVIKGGK